jgi:hypothetical protein
MNEKEPTPTLFDELCKLLAGLVFRADGNRG